MNLIFSILSSLFILACNPGKKMDSIKKENAAVINNDTKMTGIEIQNQPLPQAFFTVSSPGTIMVDENGNAVGQWFVNHFIYLQVKGNSKPEVTSLTYNGVPYSVQINKEMTDKISVGNNFNNNEAITLSATPGYSIWKISGLVKDEKRQLKSAADKIILKGSNGKQNFAYTMNGETQIQTEMMY